MWLKGEVHMKKNIHNERGIIVAIVILATRLYDVIIGIVVIFLGAFIGNYVQQNKDDVKTKLKTWIDKM